MKSQSNAGAPSRNERGQSMVLVAIMIMSFLMFFTFALNTGLLIHAKITVQSAADAAAYAGAATQGRYLNAISFLNYDMRRQYKKFLFRNFFVGAIGSPRFPNDPLTGAPVSGGGPYPFPKLDYSSGGAASANNLLVPVICIPLTAPGVASDKCVQVNLRDTSKDLRDTLGLAPGGGSAMVQNLINANNAIADYQENVCRGQGKINEIVAVSWLFKGDADAPSGGISFAEEVMNAAIPGMPATEKAKILPLMQSLVRGLGIYPRNLISWLRIKTLGELINTPPQTADLDQIESFERDSTKAESMERTILAFKSALANLNTTVFDPTKLVIEELQPPFMMNLEVVNVPDSNIFFQVTKVAPPGSTDPDNTRCRSYSQALPIVGLPVGARIIPIVGKNVVYAVKVRAFVKPRGILFAPWNEPLELTAVAGAKPFGSRVGPKALKGDDFRTEMGSQMANVRINGEKICDVSGLGKCPVPNLALGGGTDFFSREYLSRLKDLALAGGGSYDIPKLLKAQYHAMAPNPAEVGTYGILPPPYSPDEMPYQFIPFFDSKQNLNTGDFKVPIYRFYAPVFKAGTSNLLEEMKKSLEYLKNLPVDPSVAAMSGASTYDLAINSIQGYLGKLSIGTGGENQETETFAAIELPMYKIENPGPKPFWLTQAKQVLTSWGPSYTRIANGIGYAPRFGYSVKHVALRELLQEGVPDMDSELEKVAH